MHSQLREEVVEEEGGSRRAYTFDQVIPFRIIKGRSIEQCFSDSTTLFPSSDVCDEVSKIKGIERAEKV